MSTFAPVTLQDGTVAPQPAYGAGTAWFKAPEDKDGVNRPLVDSVKLALKAGFTHLDNAEAYGNEASVGAAIKESGIPREKLFITTKIGTGLNDIRGNFEKQLKLLGVSYVDLYLIHWPYEFGKPGYPSNEEAWKQLEALKDEGLAKSIGVSNYRIQDLEKTLAIAKHRPSINQIELKEATPLLNFLKKEKIAYSVYAPTGPLNKAPGGPLDPVLEKIAAAKSSSGTKVEPSQVLLKFASQLGALVITTSGKEWRMKEQLAAGGIPELTDAEIREISEVGATHPKRFYMQHMDKTDVY
ncbi:hypothetical protein MNV49_003967 [Pseudohyphozyma bogoriensis]|nr:hypothetical protein MNV49_003967 [Pseudohyphozyma bogoriensis]